MTSHTIDRAVRWWALDRGEQTAIWLSGQTVTYAELNAWVGRVATLLADSGLEIGERISFYADSSMEWCVTALAAIRCGGIVAGINSRMVLDEADYLLSQYEPVVLFADDEGAERIAGCAILRPAEGARPVARITPQAVAALRTGPPADVRRAIDTDAVVGIITTSGSTARPKGVVYSHRTMIDYATHEAMGDAVDLQDAPSKLFTAAPLSTAGGFNLLVSSMVVGGTVFLQTRFEAGEALHAVADNRINTFRGNPIFFQRMAAHPDFAKLDISCLKLAIVGGSRVADSLIQAWKAKGVLLRQLYGQTEAGGGVTINPKRYAESDPDRCGYGGPFVEIGIIDADGNFLPPNSPGEIVCRGPGVMLGYWNNPEATAEALVDGWLRTKDIGVIDERGLLKMLDRMKDMIKSGGMNISSAEVESVILELPEIEEVAIIAVRDDKFGEAAMAIIHGDSPSVPALLAHCATRLSAYKAPRYVIVSETPLPRLAMGKISKPALRDQYGGDNPLPPRAK